MADVFGNAISDFYRLGEAPAIVVNSNYTEDEEIAPAIFFRTENQMSSLEIAALKLCRGTIADIGAGAGCHALALQNRGNDITAFEKSELAAQVMLERGVKKVAATNIFDFKSESFDTLLLLMNGAGIAGTIAGLEKMLNHFKCLLNNGAQILMDSSDISYLFEEEDGSMWFDLANQNYYGEMTYNISYKSLSDSFPWLFVDFETLAQIAHKCGYNCTSVFEGDENNYLAKLEIR